jgi:hypothetical protein
MTAGRAGPRRIPLVAAALLLGPGLMGGMAGCAEKAVPELDVGRAETVMARAVSRTLHHEVGRPSCPSVVRRQVGRTFRCQVPVSGGRLRVKATVRTASGDIRVELLDAYVLPHDVELDLMRRLKSTFGRTFLADCGDKAPRVVAPGATFPCGAADGSSTRIVEVTVRDVAGGLAYRVL